MERGREARAGAQRAGGGPGRARCRHHHLSLPAAQAGRGDRVVRRHARRSRGCGAQTQVASLWAPFMRERRLPDPRAAIGKLVTQWRTRIAAAAPEDRVGTAIGWTAVAIAFAVAAIGIGGAFPEGHYASDAIIGTGGMNLWRWQTFLPINGIIDHPPTSGNYYMHHPPGVYWTVGLLGKVLGFSNWVMRLPALITVTATTWLLWRLGRELWGAIPGGLTALAYVALQNTLSFANFHGLEKQELVCSTLANCGSDRSLPVRN